MTLSNSHHRSRILSNAKLLAKSKFQQLSIQPDLTQKQRQREKDLWDEAVDLNSNLDSEDAKNWVWKPWGRPGAKKQRKMKINEEQQKNKHKQPDTRSPDQTRPRRGRPCQ